MNLSPVLFNIMYVMGISHYQIFALFYLFANIGMKSCELIPQ